MWISTYLNLHPNEYSQEFHYCPYSVKLDRCSGGCNTLNDLSDKLSIPNKAEDLNLCVFNMVTGISESKTLTKDISCECKCKFDGKNVIHINGETTTNVDRSVKKFVNMKKIKFEILLLIIAKKENIYEVLWMIQLLFVMKL